MNASLSPHAHPTPLPLRQRVVVGIPRSEVHCASCASRSACLPQTLNFVDLGRFDQLIGRERRLKKGQPLFMAGNAFRSLYALRSGAIRTTIVAEDGREQVAGYHIEGEIIGMDGIATTRHACTAVAAAETELCAMPFERIEALAQSVPGLQHNLYRLMSQELAGHHGRLLMLGSMDARERLAAFLLDLSDRYRRRGYSPSALTLHLTREELGSYLGLKLETVSRGLSRLQAAGALQVQGREIKLLDLPSLRALLGRDPRGSPA